MRCPTPDFVYSRELGVWSHCVRCHRLAWDHPQADPVQDVRNYHRIQRDRLDPADFPPVMLAVTHDEDR